MAHDAGKEAQHEDFKPITKIKDLAELRKNKDRDVMLIVLKFVSKLEI